MIMKDADATLASYKQTMGPDLGQMFYALFCDISRLYEKWGLYVELYAKSEQQIEILNRAAASFFGSLQIILWNDILLHIARLNDPARSVGKTNLTLLGFNEAVTDVSFKVELDSGANRAKDLAAFCKDWRNRILAHTDLELAIQKSARPLEPASRAKVREALAAISDFMNVISSRYNGSHILFDEDQGSYDAQDLVQVLKDGLHRG